MDTEEIMKIIKTTFDRFVYVDYNHEGVSYLVGKKHFLEEVQKQITKLQSKEDKAFGIIRGEDADVFLKKIDEIDSRIDSNIKKPKKKCYADEMKWNHNMCAMQSSCDKCSAYK